MASMVPYRTKRKRKIKPRRGEGGGRDYRHLANATLVGGTSAHCLASLILWRSMPVRPVSGFEKAELQNDNVAPALPARSIR